MVRVFNGTTLMASFYSSGAGGATGVAFATARRAGGPPGPPRFCLTDEASLATVASVVHPPWTSRNPGGGGFGRWTWVSLAVIVAAALYTDVSRFRNPSSEKYIPGYYFNGQADFSYAYLGARALLAKQNPYINSVPEFTHYIFKPEPIDGQLYKQLYPPGHLLTYLPLARIYGEDFVAAGRTFFHISLLCLVGLGVVLWRLLQRIQGEPVSPLFAFVAVTAVTFHYGVQLGLERGQSDILTALLCWGAIFAMAKQRVAVALFLCVWATSIKGYPILFSAGMGLFCLRRAVWRQAALGALAGLAVFVLPVAEYLKSGYKAVSFRSEMFWNLWFNHGFKNLAYELLGPAQAEHGRRFLTGLSFIVAALWGLRTWQHRQQLDSEEGLFSLTMFGTGSLLTMIGYSSLSVSYNLILIVPGILLLAGSQDWLANTFAPSALGRHALGAAITLAGYALFLGRWGDAFPLAGAGLVLLVGLFGGLGLTMARRPRSVVAETATHLPSPAPSPSGAT
jgi:hypothetical protein